MGPLEIVLVLLGTGFLVGVLYFAFRDTHLQIPDAFRSSDGKVAVSTQSVSRGGVTGVRVVAAVFGLIGWIALLVGTIGILSALNTLAQVSNSRPVGFDVLLAALAPYVLLSLGPFTVWGLLKGVCELHAQGERVERQNERLIQLLTKPRPAEPAMSETSP